MKQNTDQYPHKESIAEIAHHELPHRWKKKPDRMRVMPLSRTIPVFTPHFRNQSPTKRQFLQPTKQAAAPQISGAQSSGRAYQRVIFGMCPATKGDARHINH